jgi:hypothetical protein
MNLKRVLFSFPVLLFAHKIKGMYVIRLRRFPNRKNFRLAELRYITSWSLVHLIQCLKPSSFSCEDGWDHLALTEDRQRQNTETGSSLYYDNCLFLAQTIYAFYGIDYKCNGEREKSPYNEMETIGQKFVAAILKLFHRFPEIGNRV